MKIDPYQNHLDALQQKKNYECHINKVNEIKESKKKIIWGNKVEGGNRMMSPHKFIDYEKYEEKKKIERENEILMRKLKQIGDRKNMFKSPKSQKEYYAINIRSRKWRRNRRQKMIQQENDYLVSRIISHRSSKELTAESSSYQLKSPHKKSDLSTLPQISERSLPHHLTIE